MNKGKELLKKLRDGLMTLRPEEFYYRELVSGFDHETKCGTVCCALGWAPRFIPESGFYWEDASLMHELYRYEFMDSVAARTFELGIHLIDFMFYGLDDVSLTGIEPDLKKFGLRYYATLQQVINRITHVIENCY